MMQIMRIVTMLWAYALVEGNREENHSIYGEIEEAALGGDQI